MTGDPQKLVGETGTRFVRVLWCDNANVIRAKAIHAGAVAHHRLHGVGLSVGQQGLPVMYDSVVPESGLGPVGEVRLVPDWSTFTPLPYAPGHSRVMGDMVLDGEPWDLCPRAFLKRMTEQAALYDLVVVAAFENEFYLLRPTADGVVPIDETVFASTLAMDVSRPIVDRIAEALVAQGLAVEQFYPESGPGQYEISIRHAGALHAADRQIAFRETVNAVAHEHGLAASFLPKIFADKAGSGCHLHLSLWRDGRNIVADSENNGALSGTARSFIAGLLHHLPALMAITTPSPNSYRRLLPHCWSGAFRCWGVDNREAAVRVPSNPEGAGPTNFELKTMDATANPYLALGAVIAAGLDGVRRGLELADPVAVDPGHLEQSAGEQKEIERLPVRLSEAIDRLKCDEALLSAFGPGLARAFLAVRYSEAAAFEGLELADEVKLLLRRY
jgi:glutamine synthetase